MKQHTVTKNKTAAIEAAILEASESANLKDAKGKRRSIEPISVNCYCGESQGIRVEIKTKEGDSLGVAYVAICKVCGI